MMMPVMMNLKNTYMSVVMMMVQNTNIILRNTNMSVAMKVYNTSIIKVFNMKVYSMKMSNTNIID